MMRVENIIQSEKSISSRGEITVNYTYTVVAGPEGGAISFFRLANDCQIDLTLALDRSHILSVRIKLQFNGSNPVAIKQAYFMLCDKQLLDPENAIEGFKTAPHRIANNKSIAHEEKIVFYRFEYDEGLKYLAKLIRFGLIPQRALDYIQYREFNKFFKY